MERSPVLLDKIIKMKVLPKAIYIINVILIKIPTHSSQTSKEQYSTLYGETKKNRIAKTILYNNGTFRSIIIPNIKLYYKDNNENSLILA